MTHGNVMDPWCEDMAALTHEVIVLRRERDVLRKTIVVLGDERDRLRKDNDRLRLDLATCHAVLRHIGRWALWDRCATVPWTQWSIEQEALAAVRATGGDE